MKNYLFISTLVFSFITSCSNPSNKAVNIDNQTLLKPKNDKSNKNMITQKITPSVWVETTNAKDVASYYLSIFKDGKLKLIQV